LLTNLYRRGLEPDMKNNERRKIFIPLGISWDHLPEELLLRILFYLPLQDLLRMSRVCKRWNRLAFDESLWHSVDLEGLTHMGVALQQVLNIGVCRLRCPRSFPISLLSDLLSDVSALDLSSSIIPTSALESIISRCTQLEYLSLEGLQLSDAIISSLSKNTNLLQLNLSGCSGFSAPPLADMLKSCSRIERLNISWCDFSNDHVKSVVENLSSAVTQLNVSGYRESFTLDGDDSTLLMADSFPILKQLKNLRHLSLSRCYHIHLAALTDLEQMFPLLSLLEVFGLLHDSQLSSLKKELPRISVNTRPFSSIARPTPACRPQGPVRDRAMWSRTCRLRVKL
uniref:S-phase kinase-associated protein 2, E3 ubiquitin protein ligase n=1 Tax=Labrus bergylta TaxID=56723 RepID=A0A3Q3G9T6_9LABR